MLSDFKISGTLLSRINLHVLTDGSDQITISERGTCNVQ